MSETGTSNSLVLIIALFLKSLSANGTWSVEGEEGREKRRREIRTGKEEVSRQISEEGKRGRC